MKNLKKNIFYILWKLGKVQMVKIGLLIEIYIAKNLILQIHKNIFIYAVLHVCVVGC